MFRSLIIAALANCVLLLASSANAQVAKFRLETTDLDGNSIDTVTVDDGFLLNVYAQQVGGYDSPEKAGVFAGYLDVTYNDSLASIAGDVVHSDLYSNGTSADLSTSGLMNDIGGFSSAADEGLLPTPPGVEEQILFTVPMSATAPGMLEIVGGESNDYPLHEVLVWTTIEPVAARDIDFGEVDLRLDFGMVALNVQAVPEPNAGVLGMLAATCMLLARRRRKK